MAKNTEFQDFINKAIKRKEEMSKPFDLEVAGYGTVHFNRPTNNQLLNYMDKVNSAMVTETQGEGEEKETKVVSQDFIQMSEAAKELVYVCCPILQQKELQEALDIQDPFETAIEVFGVTEIIRIATEISEKADGAKIQEEVAEKVKN